MQYQCEKCRKIELVWNSRDGVTPFGVKCLCGGIATHIRFQEDRCVPDYKPYIGQRIFIDLDMDRAKEIAKLRIESVSKHYPDLTPPPIDELAKEIFGDGNCPHLKEAA
jgi:hypothetical protein